MYQFFMKAIKKSIMIGLCAFSMGALYAQELPTLSYSACIEKRGWLPAVHTGEMGAIGALALMEAFKIEVQSKISGSITYCAHIQEMGWQQWQTAGAIAGTQGEHLAIEAVKIKLTGDLAKKFDVLYRLHLRGIGYTNWMENGKVAGSSGLSLRVEAFEVKLQPKVH
jgi:uncharacterized protein YjdB